MSFAADSGGHEMVLLSKHEVYAARWATRFCSTHANCGNRRTAVYV